MHFLFKFRIEENKKIKEVNKKEEFLYHSAFKTLSLHRKTFIIMDVETFVRFTQGEERAFETLFKQYSAYMLVFARRFVPEEYVSDIVQDIFMQVWNRRAEFADAGSVKSYLFTSVKNQCLNVLRQEDVKARYLQSLTKEDFEDHMLDVEVYILLYKAISELPSNYRTAIEMSLNGSHLEEIARAMGTSIDAVKAYKKRGKELLRKKLGAVYGVVLAEVILSFIH